MIEVIRLIYRASDGAFMIIPSEGSTDIRFEKDLSSANKTKFNTLKTYCESLLEEGYDLDGIVCDSEVLNAEYKEGDTKVKTALELTESGDIDKLTSVLVFCKTLINE